MYYCLNCHRRFRYPITVLEDYGLPGPWREELPGCPYCREAGVLDRDPV